MAAVRLVNFFFFLFHWRLRANECLDSISPVFCGARVHSQVRLRVGGVPRGDGQLAVSMRSES